MLKSHKQAGMTSWRGRSGGGGGGVGLIYSSSISPSWKTVLLTLAKFLPHVRVVLGMFYVLSHFSVMTVR